MKGQWQVVPGEAETADPHKSRSADLRRLGGLALLILVVAAPIAWSSLDRSSTARCWGSSPTGAMTLARAGHTATLLRSGKVLVAGGADPQMAGSAELYDPSTGTWTATGSMRSGRSGHAAVLLRSGKVLVVGGAAPGSSGGSPTEQTWEALASAEVYDPDSGSWTETSSMQVAADSVTAIVLPSGKVFVAPGLFVQNARNYLAQLTTIHPAELFDPISNTWSVIGGQIEPLGSATLLPSGKVLVLNGRAETAQLYDPATGSWRAIAGLVATGWYTHTATLLPSAKVLVVGGSFDTPSAEIYDPATDIWTPTTPIATPVIRGFGATLIPFGEVLVAGGDKGSLGPPGPADSVEIYDAATATWTTSGVMAAARTFLTATLLPSGAVLFAGGGGVRDGVSSTAEIYAARTCN